MNRKTQIKNLQTQMPNQVISHEQRNRNEKKNTCQEQKKGSEDGRLHDRRLL